MGETHSKNTHEKVEENDHHFRIEKDPLASSLWVYVFAVNVECDQGRGSNALGRSGGHDGHEKHDKDENPNGVSHEVIGDYGGDQSRAGLSGGDREHEGGRGEAQGGGEGDGDGKPAATVEQISLGGTLGLGRLPAGLVIEDCAKVADDVDDSEHEAATGEHGEVTSLEVSGDQSEGHHLLSFIEKV